MSEETIPLTFEAVDNLSKAVKTMTDMLEKMGLQQADTTKKTEEATKATDKQGDEVQVTSSRWEVLAAKMEVAKGYYEVVAGAASLVSERVAFANEKWDEQSKKLGKSASALGSIAEANAKAEKAQNKMYAALGKAIDRSSVFQTIAISQEQLFKRLEKVIKDNSDAIAKWANDIGVNAAQSLQKFGVFVQENSEYMARFVLYITNLKNAFDASLGSISAFAKLFRTQIYGAVTVASSAIFNMIDGLIALSNAAGVMVPQSLVDARDSAKAFTDYMAQNTVDSLEDTANTALEAGKSLAKFGGNLWDIATGTPDGLKDTQKAIEAIGKTAEETGKKAQENLAKGLSGRGRRRSDLGPTEEDTTFQKMLEARLDLYEQINEKTKEAGDRGIDLINNARAEAIAKRQSLQDLQAELAILEASIAREFDRNEAEAIRFEKQAAMIQLQKELEGISDTQVRAETEKVRLAQIEFEEKTKLKALEEERFNLQTESITQMGDYLAEAFGNLPNMIDNISESTQRMVEGFSAAIPKVSELANAFRVYNKQGATAEDQQQAISAAIGAGAGILSNVTASFIEDKKKQAAIEALINAAAAAASYATGNIPAGIAYTAAAVTYGAAAAFGGGSGGGGASVSSGASSSGTYTFDRDEERRANAEAIAEALNAGNGVGDGIVINVDFGSSTNLESSPQTARRITDALAPELERMMRR